MFIAKKEIEKNKQEIKYLWKLVHQLNEAVTEIGKRLEKLEASQKKGTRTLVTSLRNVNIDV